MSTRLMFAQTAALIGALVGGLIGNALGPQVAYGVLGAGLVLLYLALQARAEMETTARVERRDQESLDAALETLTDPTALSALGKSRETQSERS